MQRNPAWYDYSDIVRYDCIQGVRFSVSDHRIYSLRYVDSVDVCGVAVWFVAAAVCPR